jgi:hypothetical protein
VVARLPGFAHGLCAHAGIFFVGLSQNRVSRKDNPPPVACRRPGLIAGVAAIDGRSGHTLGMLEFTAGVTEVYDVKALPGVRRAGMQDVLASDGYVGVETPGSVFWLKGPNIEHDAAAVADVGAGLKPAPTSGAIAAHIPAGEP